MTVDCCSLFLFSRWVMSNSLDPTDCSTPGLPVHHQLPELTQTHVHWVGYAIQPSHLLLSPSPPAFNLSQHQGLFKWVSSSHQAKVLELQLQHRWRAYSLTSLRVLTALRGAPGSYPHIEVLPGPGRGPLLLNAPLHQLPLTKTSRTLIPTLLMAPSLCPLDPAS